MKYPMYITDKDGTVWKRVSPSENYYANRGFREATEEELSRGDKSIAEAVKKYHQSVDEYAHKILNDHCNDDAYRFSRVEMIIDDLKEVYGDTLKFPVSLVAWKIYDISNSVEEPAPEPYQMIIDTDSSTDGIGFDSFEAAKSDAYDTLANWQADFSGTPDEWDYMYYNCSVYVAEYNPETEEYEACWYPEDEELQRMCWTEYKEIPDEYKKLLFPEK